MDEKLFNEIRKILDEHLYLTQDEQPAIGGNCIHKIYSLISSQLEPQVSGILADFENLLIDVMGSRKCSIGSLENYYDPYLEVKRISELYSKLQEYFTVSQNSR